MADVQIGYVGRGRYGEPVFRVKVENGRYDDVVGSPVYRPNQNRDAPSQRLLGFADIEVPIRAGQDKTLTYKLIQVISDTLDGLNRDWVARKAERSGIGYIQRNPRIMTNPRNAPYLVPDAANHSHIADQIPEPDEYLRIEGFFDRYDDVAEDFETPDIPDSVKAELEEGQRAQEKLAEVRKVVADD